MEPIKVTADNFQAEVLDSQQPVLLDFWADWCGYCKMLSPVVDQIAASAEGFKVAKINADDNMEIAARYNVTALPTIIAFKDGKEYRRSTGAVPKEQILGLLK